MISMYITRTSKRQYTRKTMEQMKRILKTIASLRLRAKICNFFNTSKQQTTGFDR